MKFRTGFVSNSSSCSFVLGKSFMTPDQIKSLYLLLVPLNRDSDETYIHNGNLYFHGSIDHEDCAKLEAWLKKNALIEHAEFAE